MHDSTVLRRSTSSVEVISEKNWRTQSRYRLVHGSRAPSDLVSSRDSEKDQSPGAQKNIHQLTWTTQGISEMDNQLEKYLLHNTKRFSDLVFFCYHTLGMQ